MLKHASTFKHHLKSGADRRTYTLSPKPHRLNHRTEIPNKTIQMMYHLPNTGFTVIRIRWRNEIPDARSANSRYMVKGVKSMCAARVCLCEAATLACGARRVSRARCAIMFGTRAPHRTATDEHN